MNIVALGACHNRRELTLRALRALSRQDLAGDCSLEICLVDDGSSDGTREAVRAEFPSVILLEGPGNLFWAGGMRFGWERFVASRDPDRLLVFNDDIELYPTAISVLQSAAGVLESQGCDAYAVAGALQDPATGATTYGGLVRDRWWYPLSFASVAPSDDIRDCETLNMNFALLSRGALARVGFLSPEFTHRKADFDFGLRLRRAGGRVVVAPGYVGECRRNPVEGTSEESDISLSERWRRVTSVKEHALRERAVYCRRHAGRLWPLIWLVPYLRAFGQGGRRALRSLLSRPTTD